MPERLSVVAMREGLARLVAAFHRRQAAGEYEEYATRNTCGACGVLQPYGSARFIQYENQYDEIEDGMRICHVCRDTLDSYFSQASLQGEVQAIVEAEGYRYMGFCSYCARHIITSTAYPLLSLHEVEHYHYTVVCGDCYRNNFVECVDCGDVVTDYREIRNEYYCDNCCDNRFWYCEDCDEYHVQTTSCPQNSPSAIRSYSYRPQLQYLAAEKEAVGPDTQYYGIELEVEWSVVPYERRDRVLEAIGEREFVAAIKNDGSLRDGFEIVTHPGTALYWEEQKDEWKELLKILAGAGCRSHTPGTCGLHVHVGRKRSSQPMSPLGLYRFMRLVYGYPTFSLAISRRAEQQLSQWAALENPEIMARKASQKLNQSSRYVAVNLSDKGTAELRLYRGTLKASSFFAALEHAFALAEFANDDSISLKDCTLVNLLNMVKTNKRFVNLVAFAEAKRPITGEI